MILNNYPETGLIEKISRLPADKISLVENFVNSLLAEAEGINLTQEFTQLSELALAKIWDNLEDAEYDKL